MLIRSLIAVSISLVFAASPSAEDAVESKTPPAEHFQFQGNQTFTDAQLRRALVADPDVLLAIHPLGTSDKLADRLTETLVAGYRGHGFPSPKVNVQPTTDPIGATISIEEGRRLQNGDIVVRGMTDADAQRLVERLTVPYAETNAFPDFTQVEGQTVTSWVNEEGKAVKLKDPVWEVGRPVALHQQDTLPKKVHAALADLGLSQAEAEVRLLIDDASDNVPLIIELASLGSRDQIDQIELRGTTVNSRPAILDLLDVEPGSPIDHERLAEMTRLLWQSGRFKKHQLTYRRNSAGKGRLVIDLQEIPDVPAVDQPIDQAAFVYERARKWLGQLHHRGIDVAITFCDKQKRLRFIQSKDGMLLQSYQAADSDRDESVSPTTAESPSIIKPVATILLDNGRVMLAHAGVPEVWTADTDRVAGQFEFQTKIGASTEADSTFHMSFGGNFNSFREKGLPPIGHRFNLSRADWIPFAYKRTLSHEWLDGRLLATDKSNRLEIDTSTGEILAWESDGLTLRFEEGLFERERQRTFEAYAGKPNAFQTETPLSSLAGYLCQPAIWRHVTELLPGYHQESSSETPAPLDTALLSGLEKLIDAGSLRPLDAAISRIGTDQEQKEKEPFRLPAPSTRPQGLQAGAKVLAARAALALAPRVLEEGQWQMQLTREVCLVLLDRGHYTGQVIQQLLQDPDCGPLCYATIAALLEKAGHPASSAVARRGLGQLTPENFSKDMTVLLQGKSGLWLQEMIAAIASLTPSERDAVAAHLTPPLFQALFLQAHTIGRRAADEKLPLHEAAYRVSHDHLRDWLEAQTVR